MIAARLLHITDLHFSGDGKPEVADFKVESAELRQMLLSDRARTFLSRMRTRLAAIPSQDDWPKAVIVTGDVCGRGGANPREMQEAAAFLRELA